MSKLAVIRIAAASHEDLRDVAAVQLASLQSAYIRLNRMAPHLRIARPVTNLERARTMYCQGPGLRVIGSFENHSGFDGVMLGIPGASYHFEFTHCRSHPVVPSPTTEDLAVFYLPTFPEWQLACANLLAAGFEQVTSVNPYWEALGKTYEDQDGYRVVLQNADWSHVEAP